MKLQEINAPLDVPVLMEELDKYAELLTLVEEVQLPAIENVTAPSNLQELLDDAIRKFTVARKSLGIVNKFKDAENRKKYGKMAMANLNKLRGLMKRIEKKLESVLSRGSNNPAANKHSLTENYSGTDFSKFVPEIQNIIKDAGADINKPISLHMIKSLDELSGRYRKVATTKHGNTVYQSNATKAPGYKNTFWILLNDTKNESIELNDETFIIEAKTGFRNLDKLAQKVWTATSLDDKKSAINAMIDSFKFKEKQDKFRNKVMAMRTPTQVDKLAADLMLVGHGDKVVK